MERGEMGGMEPVDVDISELNELPIDKKERMSLITEMSEASQRLGEIYKEITLLPTEGDGETIKAKYRELHKQIAPLLEKRKKIEELIERAAEQAA